MKASGPDSAEILIRYYIRLMVILGDITRPAVSPNCVRHQQWTGSTSGSSSSYADPLLVDSESSKPRRGSANGLSSSIDIGRHFLYDKAEYRHSTIVYRKYGLRSGWINK